MCGNWPKTAPPVNKIKELGVLSKVPKDKQTRCYYYHLPSNLISSKLMFTIIRSSSFLRSYGLFFDQHGRLLRFFVPSPSLERNNQRYELHISEMTLCTYYLMQGTSTSLKLMSRKMEKMTCWIGIFLTLFLIAVNGSFPIDQNT